MINQVKHIKLITFIASILFITSIVSNAQDDTQTKTVNIEDCIRIAFENNMQLAAARNRLGIAEADRTKASFLLPSNPTINSKAGTRQSPSPARRHTDYGFSLSQEFQVFGQRRKRINVSNKKIERVRFEIADVERNVIAKVKTNFYEVLTTREILKLREYVESIFKKQWDATRERYKAGAISALELNSIQIGYGQARQQHLVAKSNYQNSLLNLKLLLGKQGDEVLNIEGKLSDEKLEISMDDILEAAYKTRPDLRAVEYEKERASEEISLRKAEIVPNPSLSGFFSREEGADDIVGGSVSISIPVWDRKQPELKKARIAKNTADINIRKKQLEIQNEVETAYRSFMAAKGGVVIYTDEIMPQVKENQKLNEISYREGKINFILFLTLQSGLIETRTTYLNALFDYCKAVINLEAVSGMKIFP